MDSLKTGLVGYQNIQMMAGSAVLILVGLIFCSSGMMSLKERKKANGMGMMSGGLVMFLLAGAVYYFMMNTSNNTKALLGGMSLMSAQRM